jgi:CHRD domain
MSITRKLAVAALAGATMVLSAGTASADGRMFVAYLYGGNERPAAGSAVAFGMATVTISSPTSLCYSIILNGTIVSAAAHIHSGAAGVAGPISVPLTVNATVPLQVAGCVTTTAANVNLIRANPQNFYVNVHNAGFPSGAARGQLQ